MQEAHIQTMIFVIATLAVGAVIFGGTTLAYFLGKRPSHSRSGASAPGSSLVRVGTSAGPDEQDVREAA